jgi:TPR repeat protein
MQLHRCADTDSGSGECSYTNCEELRTREDGRMNTFRLVAIALLITVVPYSLASGTRNEGSNTRNSSSSRGGSLNSDAARKAQQERQAEKQRVREERAEKRAKAKQERAEKNKQKKEERKAKAVANKAERARKAQANKAKKTQATTERYAAGRQALDSGNYKEAAAKLRGVVKSSYATKEMKAEAKPLLRRATNETNAAQLLSDAGESIRHQRPGRAARQLAVITRQFPDTTAAAGATASMVKVREVNDRLVADANAGDPAAQLKVSMIHLDMEQPEQAIPWLEKAAASSNVEAQYRLGHMYYQGSTVKQDDVRAYVWFSRAAAAESGHGVKQARQGLQVLEKRMSAEAIVQARDVAIEAP